jgi:HEAT repeat protein
MTFDTVSPPGPESGMKGTEDKISALLELLESRDRTEIRAAVDALINLSSSSALPKPILEQLLADSSRENRWAIGYILGHLPQPSAAAIASLLDGLDHSEPDIRWAIVLLLVRLAQSDVNVVQQLLALSARGTANQRRMAIYCIRDLRLADDASMAALSSATADQDSTVRVAAVTSLRWRADAGASTRRLLLDRFVGDEDGKVRNAAAVTLAQLGTPDGLFVQALEECVSRGDAHARKAALAALDIIKNKRPAPNGS